MFHYQAFGLHIHSNFECPQFIPTFGKKQADVSIRLGNVPDALESPIDKGVRYEINSDEFLLHVDHIAGFYVRNGCEIVIDKAEAAGDADVRAFLYGTPLGVLLQQRNKLTLQASAIRVQDKAILFCGNSEAGKSSLAYQFMQQDFGFITDSIAAISLDAENKTMIESGQPIIHVWADVLTKSGLKIMNYQQIRPGLQKYEIPVNGHFQDTPLPVHKIYIISRYNKKEILCELLHGVKKFEALMHHTFYFNYFKGQEKLMQHFQLVAPIAQQIKVCKVSIPRNLRNYENLHTLLQEDFQK